MKRSVSLFILALGLLIGTRSGAAPKKPVYVGVRVCGTCHNGPTMGHQYSKWLMSKHARGYAALSLPESREIAKVSGIRELPWKSPVCLGCHSTASTTENWEKDDGFRVEDGLQCESCHGPGSEYASATVMRDRKAAMAAGLQLPTTDTCMGCHKQKGSHEAVLNHPTVDIEKAIKEIAHPLPKPAKAAGLAEGRGGDFIGSAACGKCHNEADHGHQYDVWRRSPHAQAWAVLATEKGRAAALKQNIQGDPQQAKQCLACHAVGAEVDEGVGCEACHGAGAKYANEVTMRDRAAAKAAGLRIPPKTGCTHCHKGSEGKPFDAEAGWKKIAHPTKLAPVAEAPRYKTPLNMALRPNSTELWATLEASDAVAIVDLKTNRRLAEIPTGGAATAVAFTPDGKRAFVSNRSADTVSVIDTAARKVVATLKTGDEPHGLLTDRAGKYLYVVNTASDDIHVFEVSTLKFVKKLAGGRGPWSLALSPDGKTLLASNMFSHITGFRQPLRSEVTVIDTERAVVTDRLKVPGVNLMMGISWHPSGEYALATMNRTKGLVPMTRLMQGWTITNGLLVIWKDGRVDQVLLDQPGLGFANATDVRITPDGRQALVTSAGTDRVAVVDCAKLIGLVKSASDADREAVLPNHLGKSADFVVKYLSTPYSPRGMVMSADGATAYVANAIDDSISPIDLRRLAIGSRIDLDGPKVETKQRYGERLFHNAGICFRRQFACASCHPDGHIDGITYDIEADGIGVSPVDNRTLRGIFDTAPFKWEGTNPTLNRQCGPRLSVLFTRIQPFTQKELDAVEYYITTIPRPPNRYHTPGERYTDAQKRGKVVFERTTTNDGRAIPNDGRCVFCHMPPYYTSRQLFDVGTRQALDRQGKFDVPHLNNIYDSPPYLHNGMAPTLEEIWTIYNPYDKHGYTNDMTKDQLNDLIEYLKTL